MKLVKFKSPKKFYMEEYMDDFKEEMNDLLKRSFKDFEFLTPVSERKISHWKPAVELTEQNGNYMLKAEIPGIKKEDIEIEIGEDAIEIKAEMKEHHEEKGENIYKSEFRYGKFARCIPFPSEIESDQAKAEYKDGILTITVPKSKEEQKKIKKIKPE